MRSAQMYERGAIGERATGEILDVLRQEGWAVFHDVKWPGRPRANIDHVVVGPPGVYVIDSKNWAGRIEIDNNAFRSNGRKHDKTVASAGDAALAVAGLLSAPAAATTRSVLCFVRDEPVAGWCYDVMFCSTANLREMLLTRPTALTPDQVRAAGIELDIRFRDAVSRPVMRPPAVPVAARQPGRGLAAGSVVGLPRPRAPRRKRSAATGLLGLAVSVGLTLVAINQLPNLADRIGDNLAGTLTPTTATSYESCEALRKDYPKGVGTAAAVARMKRTKGRPVADSTAYAANSALDTDRDGLACERGQKAR